MQQPRLTKQVTWHLLSDTELQAELCKLCGIKPVGIYSAIHRRSTTLTTYHAVMLISERMGWPPETLVELTD